jgi:hypothetical protein
VNDILQTAFQDLASEAPHNPDLADDIRRRSRYRRAVLIVPAAAALAVVIVLGTVVLARPAAIDPTASHPSACAPVHTGVLPVWARSGFSDPEPVMPFVTSRSGAMLAIIFADPLVSPALPNLGNKILWATDTPIYGDPLVISGRVEGGTATMHATVDGGPGPSIIDVPTAGCWLFDLTWGTHHDTIDILYATS